MSSVAQRLFAREQHSHENLQKLLREAWHGPNNIHDKAFESIAANGMQQYYDSLPDRERVFMSPQAIEAGKGVCACCSDEGNRLYCGKGSENRMLLIRSPGSGILDVLDRDDKDAFAPPFIDAVAREAVAVGVTVFTGHKGCGAAKAVFLARIAWLREQGESKQAETLEKKGSEIFTQEWASAVADRMRAIAKEVEIPHSDSIHSDFIEKLERPEEIHVARIIYVTDEDSFDASYPSLPQGFVERTGGKDLQRVLRHVEILRRIGFHEEHGFGTFFSEKPSEQFFICCIAATTQRLDVLKAHALQQVRRLPQEVRGKIRVEGFVRNR